MAKNNNSKEATTPVVTEATTPVVTEATTPVVTEATTPVVTEVEESLIETQLRHFFVDYPGVAEVLVAGDCIFLKEYPSEAASYANRIGVELLTVQNPNL